MESKIKKNIKAIQPGGPSTAFIRPDKLDTPMDHQSYHDIGSSIGCGVVRFITEGTVPC